MPASYWDVAGCLAVADGHPCGIRPSCNAVELLASCGENWGIVGAVRLNHPTRPAYRLALRWEPIPGRVAEIHNVELTTNQIMTPGTFWCAVSKQTGGRCLLIFKRQYQRRPGFDPILRAIVQHAEIVNCPDPPSALPRRANRPRPPRR